MEWKLWLFFFLTSSTIDIASKRIFFLLLSNVNICTAHVHNSHITCHLMSLWTIIIINIIVSGKSTNQVTSWALYCLHQACLQVKRICFMLDQRFEPLFIIPFILLRPLFCPLLEQKFTKEAVMFILATM